MKKSQKNVLIAYIPNYKDLVIARDKHWYRIPIDTKVVPLSVKNKTLELIAFYQPKIFKDQAFKITYYAYVNKINIATRKQLFRNEPENPKSNRKYYKIIISKLLRLPNSIYSRRKRRILFIPTTFERFKNAIEINDLFIESYIEELIWKELNKNKILAERQYLETINNKNFFLDFAIFCKERKLAIECDGDKYHLNENNVKSDKKRDNLLTSVGWNILRYTSDDIKYKINDTITQVKETINKYGGVQSPEDESKYFYFPPKNNQDSLFE